MERDDVGNSVFSRAVQIAAARARVTVDSKRGVVTPEWIIELSKEAKQETNLEKLRREIILKGL